MDNKHQIDNAGATITRNAVLLAGTLLATLAAAPSTQPSAEQETPQATLSLYLSSLKSQDAASLAGCFAADNGKPQDYVLEYCNLLASERRLLEALLARFHASDNELCDDLIYLDDDFVGRMAAANARSTTTITGDSANLQLDVSGHKERTRFVRQGGGWKIDPPEFFQPPTRGSPLKTKELKDRFSRERTLVETILFAVDQGKIATTRDAVGQLASGFEAIEAPPAAQMPSAATGPCTGPATTDKRAQRGTETPK